MVNTPMTISGSRYAIERRPISNQNSIARRRGEPSGMARRQSAPAGRTADPIRQLPCHGEDHVPAQSRGSAADDHRREHSCRLDVAFGDLCSWHTLRSCRRTLSHPGGEACKLDLAVWQRRLVERPVMHELRRGGPVRLEIHRLPRN